MSIAVGLIQRVIQSRRTPKEFINVIYAIRLRDYIQIGGLFFLVYHTFEMYV